MIRWVDYGRVDGWVDVVDGWVDFVQVDEYMSSSWMRRWVEYGWVDYGWVDE